MQYKVEGENLPVLKCFLEAGESIQCEAGAMAWMDDEIEMQTQAGGFGKMFGRLVTGEKMFLNTYQANRAGEIVFASKFPGSIRAVEITPDHGLIVQKGCYLATFGDIESEVYLQKRVSSGFFGGEGFLMRRFYGSGLVFLEIDGSAHDYTIPAGDCKGIDTSRPCRTAAVWRSAPYRALRTSCLAVRACSTPWYQDRERSFCRVCRSP